MDTHDRTVKPKTEEIASLDDVAKPLDSFGKLIFFVVLIEIVLMIGLNLYQKSRVTTLTNELQTKQTELNSAEYRTLNTQVEEVLAGNEQLKIVLASKVDWTKFYAKLNAVTPKNTRLTSISVTDAGTFKADGETASLSSLAQALTAWKDGAENAQTPFVSIVLTNNGFTNDGGSRRVSFSISGQIDLGRLK